MNEPISTRFSNSGEVEQASEYRHFNLLAILAAILGVASGSVLASSFLLIIPLLAVFLGACGLASYRRQEERGGRWQAWLGIALGLFFLSWSAAHFSFHRCVEYSQAYRVVSDWMHLVVQGEQEIAHQGMMSVTRRQAAGMSVDEYYSMDEEARKAKEDIFGEPPMSELINFGENATVELVKNLSVRHDIAYTTIEQIIRVTPENGEPQDLEVSTVREINKSLAKPGWIINTVKTAKPASLSFVSRLSRFVTQMLAG